ncbi:MAG: leucyl aminopeptidase [Proteobacteria bacterium]|nr:leucyl aminopeptidase [Pseudomonadota bacterium]
MAQGFTVSYGSNDAGLQPVVLLFMGDTLALPDVAGRLGPEFPALFRSAAEGEGFKGKAGSALDLVAPQNVPAGRVIVIGTGSDADRAKINWTNLGGKLFAKLPAGRTASILLDIPGADAAAAADVALGLSLRAYGFEKYKTKKKSDEDAGLPGAVTLHLADHGAAKKQGKARDGLAEGIIIARDLVNEPPNVLTPTEFARRASQLQKLGVEIEILGEKEMRKIGMRALLGVGQGSAEESQVVIMRWNGAKNAKDAPVAFIGKGVVFDTGGISIKPAAGMEDMKGDMAGAACVVGLMHALASRKAKCNVIGAIGLVENMPDGKAQRPGDIVTSLSGQTIEIINTDAEGRLVLADVLWYVQDRFKPKFMVNLATLTGAILVALGQDYAGLFSNNDELAQRLFDSGKATGEKLWRLPMGPEYDKIIDSRFADVKNSGGRYAGSITAAQFLQRFVNDVPWAHLDIAGTGMAAPNSDINRSWGPGWGVRLLDRLVKDHYE